RLYKTDLHIFLDVADSGCGIPAEERERVTERFYRAERARNTKGNGLGLSLVKAIAEAHAAELRLEDNRPGLIVRLIFKTNASSIGKKVA
ncbi:MAG: sensor histidine kinase, partial [Pseudomonadota bacterium]